jgi:tetratricopeptide (TPR) repeat protein
MKTRRPHGFWSALAGAALLLGRTGVEAHGDVHEQIDALTKQISKEPAKAALYAQRGELHRVHGDWDAALADFDQVGVLDPKWPTLDFLRGRVLAEAQWLRSAKISLDRFLERRPEHVEARVVRARVLVQLGQRLAAVQDYTRALAKTIEPRPDLYIERAQALAAEGRAHLDQAVEGLDEGMRKLGPLATLQLTAVDLEAKRNRLDAALARLDKLAAQSPRQEAWLARRGNLLREAGRFTEARAAYWAALAALEKLPPTRRNVPAMVELEKQIRAALATLEPAAGGPPGKAR